MTSSIVIATQLQCSPTEAFQSWTDAEKIMRWWGEPTAYRVIAWTGDLVEGGDWRAEFQMANEMEFAAGGSYQVVSSPDRLEWTWNADWDPQTTIQLRMTFSPNEGGTLLSLRSEGFADDVAAAEGIRGWNEITDWLKHYHAEAHSSP
jgi:uncharacterized protein YndB with AHSA1/START domain